MSNKLISEELSETIDYWLKELDRYSFEQLCIQPSPGSWSIGQVYVHLISNTDYFILQAKICASTNDNQHEEPSAAGKNLLLKNEFPDKLIEGPPQNAHTRQPTSKQELVEGLNQLKLEIVEAEKQVAESSFNGKTKHPGLQYFNSREWLQFAVMHFRHHLRQKKRIDDYLSQLISR